MNSGRLKRELEKLAKEPPSGISCYMKNDKMNLLEADITGPEGTPYESGTFKVEIQLTGKYPFEPPALKFITKIFHPNIDTEGRICMDLLKMPPAGGWRPTIGIEALLIALRMLLQYPNPDDPLMVDIADKYKNQIEEFKMEAKEYTEKYAARNM